MVLPRVLTKIICRDGPQSLHEFVQLNVRLKRRKLHVTWELAASPNSASRVDGVHGKHHPYARCARCASGGTPLASKGPEMGSHKVTILFDHQYRNKKFSNSAKSILLAPYIHITDQIGSIQPTSTPCQDISTNHPAKQFHPPPPPPYSTFSFGPAIKILITCPSLTFLNASSALSNGTTVVISFLTSTFPPATSSIASL